MNWCHQKLISSWTLQVPQAVLKMTFFAWPRFAAECLLNILRIPGQLEDYRNSKNRNVPEAWTWFKNKGKFPTFRITDCPNLGLDWELIKLDGNDVIAAGASMTYFSESDRARHGNALQHCSKRLSFSTNNCCPILKGALKWGRFLTERSM